MGLPYHGGPDGFRPARACRTRYARGRGSRRAGAAPEGRAMSGHRGRAMAALVGVLLLAGTAGAQNFAAVGWEKFFALDWEAAAHRGRPVVRGHVVNEYGAPATRIQLLVEGLDGARAGGAAPPWGWPRPARPGPTA